MFIHIAIWGKIKETKTQIVALLGFIFAMAFCAFALFCFQTCAKNME